MRFQEKIITLKDGRKCILKPTVSEYAQEMIDYMMETAGESPFLLRYPDEIHYTLQDEIDFLNRALEDSRTIMMMAMVDGEVVGNSSINPIGMQRRILHRGSFAIALRKKYWGLGIGTAIIEYISELSKQAGYEQIELGVIDGNDRGKNLYQKCGFTEIGKQTNAIKYDDGTYKDEFLMTKKLI